MRKVFPGLVDLERGRARVLPLAGFDILNLDSLDLDFLVLNPWVLIFAKVALEGR